MKLGISIARFAALARQAQQALAQGNHQTIEAINVELATGNCRLVVVDGNLCVKPIQNEKEG